MSSSSSIESLNDIEIEIPVVMGSHRIRFNLTSSHYNGTKTPFTTNKLIEMVLTKCNIMKSLSSTYKLFQRFQLSGIERVVNCDENIFNLFSNETDSFIFVVRKFISTSKRVKKLTLTPTPTPTPTTTENKRMTVRKVKQKHQRTIEEKTIETTKIETKEKSNPKLCQLHSTQLTDKLSSNSLHFLQFIYYKIKKQQQQQQSQNLNTTNSSIRALIEDDDSDENDAELKTNKVRLQSFKPEITKSIVYKRLINNDCDSCGDDYDDITSTSSSSASSSRSTSSTSLRESLV
jgi:hypothetical protein